MLACFAKSQTKNATPITILLKKDFPRWLKQQTKIIRLWLESSKGRGDAANIYLIPDTTGKLKRVIFCVADIAHFWNVGSLPFNLPEGVYTLEVNPAQYENFAIAWGLGAYQFTRYKKSSKNPAQLLLPKKINQNHILNMVQSIYLVRDLINTPTDDMGPSELAAIATDLAKSYQAKITHIVGDNLLKNNYPTIHTVGRASDDPPRLIDLRWGNKKHPKVTLVGKGVCFDTGGLDIKPASAMLLMKKDMGGAAHVLGLARMIMDAKLPIQLRVLIPAVENAISGNAYRPGDVIKSRKGLTIEIGNTDAEGRLVLADALTEAVSEKPELLIDLATLTGAARVALGTELPALFVNEDSVADKLLRQGIAQCDPLWRLPLYALYRDLLNSSIADINNSGSDSYAGAITAALFLKEFVPDTIPWIHVDMMAWNLKARPGRPQGGEAMGLRALFNYLVEKYAQRKR
jgi:leucyl aminopeptidase